MAGSSGDQVRIEPGRKCVRVYLEGELAADTTRTRRLSSIEIDGIRQERPQSPFS